MGTGYDVCPACGSTCAVSASGLLRRHPKGSLTPCPGSGVLPEPVSTPTQIRTQAGLYRSDEPMMDPGMKAPYGHATLSVVAHFRYDGTNGRTPEQEAALLFEDPAYLMQVLDAIPNTQIRVLMKVEA